jgi:hypothetical protein
MTAIPMPLRDDEIAGALDIARGMAAAGIPLFVASPCYGARCVPRCVTRTEGKGTITGYHLPSRWEATTADPSVVDSWQPGWALCALGGVLGDWLDIDPRSGGSESAQRLAEAGQWPVSYGRAATPSGGVHELIAPLHVGTAAPLGKGTPAEQPGIDLRGGRPDGSGRGFVYLAPTVRRSKVDGAARGYRWLAVPDLAALTARGPTDHSGASIAGFVGAPKAHKAAATADVDDFFVPGLDPSYVNARIRGCLDAVTAHARQGWEGFRDTLALHSAYEIGGYVGAGHLSYDEAMNALAQAIRYAGFEPDDSDLKWIHQGLDDGAAQPMRIKKAETWGPVRSAVEIRSVDHGVMGVLPPNIRDYITSAAKSSQTAPEMSLLACLAAASFATGGSAVVNLNGFLEPLGLWVVVTLPPSERKSAVIDNAARYPLTEAIADFWRSRSAEQNMLGHEIDASSKRIEAIKRELSKDMDPDHDDLHETKRNTLETELSRNTELRQRVVPVPIWSITDSNVESLEAAMVEFGGTVASFADESALLNTIAGRYTNGSISLGSLNSAWSAGTIHVRRMTGSREVTRPHLVLCQYVQPDRFADVMGLLRDQQDGFLSRWLYLDLPSSGPKRPQSTPIDPMLAAAWASTLRELLERFWGRHDRTQLALSSGAWRQYCEIFAEIEAERVACPDGMFAQWLGKAANGVVTRLAALLELVHNTQATEISEGAVQTAVALYRWLHDEAYRAIRGTSGEELRPTVEREVLSWIKAQRARDAEQGDEIMMFIAASDLRRALRRFRRMQLEEVENVLTLLEGRGWLRRVDRRGSQGGRGRSWAIHPDLENIF